MLLALWLLTPLFLADDFWLSVLNYAGIAAIGAIGLNLLTGYTGQVSLGHAFFIGAGAYTAGQVGGELNLPLLLWLPAAGLLGAAVGALIGPFALRLRGNYLAIVTLGLVFLGEHLFRNLESVTGGNSGTSVTASAAIGPLDFASMSLLGDEYTLNQSWFWLIWGMVGLCALLAKNIVRTRPGRAMQAVRDRDVAAEIIGVELGRYKVGAFALSSALAAMAGALLRRLPAVRQPGRVDALPVDPVHRDHHRRRGRHDLRLGARRAVPRRAPGADRATTPTRSRASPRAPATTASSRSSRSTRPSSAC